jgi:hypothetical protein
VVGTTFIRLDQPPLVVGLFFSTLLPLVYGIDTTCSEYLWTGLIGGMTGMEVSRTSALTRFSVYYFIFGL